MLRNFGNVTINHLLQLHTLNTHVHVHSIVHNR